MLAALYAAVLAHLLADFLLQSDRMCAEKSVDPRRGLGRHVALVAAVNMLLLSFFGPVKAVSFAGLVAGAHLIIDGGKIWFERRGEIRNGMLIFSLDQLLHLAVIGAVWHIVYKRLPLRLLPAGAAYLLAGSKLAAGEEILLEIMVIAAAVYAGDVIIKLALQEVSGYTDMKATSRYIGMAERLLVIMLMQMGEVGAIGFIFAAKSVARFQKQDKEFASYYLLGTLLSLLLAIGAGQVLVALGS